MTIMTLHAILIDPENEQVVDFEIDDTLEAWQTAVGGHIEEHRLATRDMLIVDEEGRYKNPKHAFVLAGLHPSVFVGKGLIVGPPRGGHPTDRTKHGVAWYAAKIQFRHLGISG